MNNKTTGWIQTSEGIAFYPLEPDEESVSIQDIAHSLSMQCRYAGHCIQFYSIAEHCCHIYDMCSNEARFYGLMHDASEAYLVDIPRPVKQHLPEYIEAEDRLMKLILSQQRSC